ncbi:MAG: hypothetical protein QOD90_168 [Mycobacterium sp.]|nr:hypothetical protein [Mycobacterium sp.]
MLQMRRPPSIAGRGRAVELDYEVPDRCPKEMARPLVALDEQGHEQSVFPCTGVHPDWESYLDA